MMKRTKSLIIIGLLLVICMITANIFAASSISVSSSSIYVGDTVTVTATVSSVAAWGMNISVSGPAQYISGTLSDANATDNALNGSKTISATYKATSTGTITFNLSGDTTTQDGVNANISGSRTVRVTERPVVTPPTPPPTTPPTNTGGINKPNTNTPNNTNKPTGNQNNNTSLNNNAFLSEFRVDFPDMSPGFSKTIYNYTLSVGEDVNNIAVTAVPEDNRATVEISGNNDLKIGDNDIIVRVTAQDKKTVNTYKIVVTKADNPIKANAYLQNIVVKGATLTPEFSKEIFEYNLGEIKSDIDKLDLAIFPENEKATYVIEGNDKLKQRR